MLSTLLSITNSQEEIAQAGCLLVDAHWQETATQKAAPVQFWYISEILSRRVSAILKTCVGIHIALEALRKKVEKRRSELEESPGRQPNVVRRREKVKQINPHFALIYDSPSGGRNNGYRSTIREKVEQDVLAGQSKLLAAR
jgi:hypothetical protein